MSGWRERVATLTAEKSGECPSCKLPKLTEPPFVSFGSEQNGTSPEIALGTESPDPDDIRARLLALAEAECLPATLIHALPDAEVAACGGHPDHGLRGYLRALDAGTFLDRGIPPPAWGTPVTRICEGCGPVLLWAESPPTVKACPWCFRRKAGKPIATGCTHCGGLRGCTRCRRHKENLPSLIGLVRIDGRYP
ncbi:MAG: hypothetical protein QM601_02400 [Pseudoxanthomonas sp.]